MQKHMFARSGAALIFLALLAVFYFHSSTIYRHEGKSLSPNHLPFTDPKQGSVHDSHVSPQSSPPVQETTDSTPNQKEDTPVPSTSEAPQSTYHPTDLPAESAVGWLQEGRVVVMGRLQHENTDWVAEFLPDWQHAIYTVDNTSFPLHTGVNKGREANPYLSYIIEHYDKLPSTMAFVHSHRGGYPAAWHTDAEDYDNVKSLKNLNFDFVQRNGYANLRFIWIPGCPDEVKPYLGLEMPDPEGVRVDKAVAEVWPLFFKSRPLPELIAAPCCAQFAVSRDQVRKRPLSDYRMFHQWLMDTPLIDGTSGRMFEYIWHIIFGQEPVYCPELQQCYNEVYGGKRKAPFR